jgi:two-component system, OmpR family, sensor kinase
MALEDAGGAKFPGRREAVAAALRNLVDNALRPTPEGGAVTVIAGPCVRLAVRDEGPGLSADRLADLAQRGRRAGHASPSGAGLGLTIVAKIMAAHDGALCTDAARRGLILDFRRT